MIFEFSNSVSDLHTSEPISFRRIIRDIADFEFELECRKKERKKDRKEESNKECKDKDEAGGKARKQCHCVRLSRLGRPWNQGNDGHLPSSTCTGVCCLVPTAKPPVSTFPGIALTLNFLIHSSIYYHVISVHLLIQNRCFNIIMSTFYLNSLTFRLGFWSLQESIHRFLSSWSSSLVRRSQLGINIHKVFVLADVLIAMRRPDPFRYTISNSLSFQLVIGILTFN